MSRRTEPVDRLTGTSVDNEILGPAEPPPVDRLLACADLLACPQCGHPLAAPIADPAVADPPRTLRCPQGHSFDLAKQGYVSLLTGASTKMTGDTPAMLDARAAFQSAGHFAPIAEALARAITTPLPHLEPGLDTPVFGAESTTAVTRPEHTPTAPRANDITPSSADTDPGKSDVAETARLHKFAATHPPAPIDAVRGRITTPGMSVTAASAAHLASILLSAGSPAPDRSHATSQTASVRSNPAVLEIGAGTGYYLAAVLEAVAGARGIALDVSKAAARRAARAHPRAGSVLADAWRGLPVRDGAVDAVVCVFAPRNADEVARVLAPGGRFVVVTPTTRHLGELVGPLGMVSVDAAKQYRLAESLGERFELVERSSVEYSMRLSRADVANVVAMGPSAFHAGERRAERLAGLPDPASVTASVTVSVYRPR